MNIETTFRDFLLSLVPKIQDAGGVLEIHSAFSSFYEDEKWTAWCLENIVEIYERANDLLEQLQSNGCVEDEWLTLNDLAFHAAIFGCYYHIFDSMLQGDLSCSDRIVENDHGADLRQVLKDTIKCFVSLTEAFDKKDVVAQHRHLTELYIASSQLQYFAGKAKLGT